MMSCFSMGNVKPQWGREGDARSSGGKDVGYLIFILIFDLALAGTER